MRSRAGAGTIPAVSFTRPARNGTAFAPRAAVAVSRRARPAITRSGVTRAAPPRLEQAPEPRASLAAHAELTGELVPVVRSRRNLGGQACARRIPSASAGPGSPRHARRDCLDDLLPLARGDTPVQPRGPPGRRPGARTERRSGCRSGRGCGTRPPRRRPAWRAGGPGLPAPRRARGRGGGREEERREPAQGRPRGRRQRDPEAPGPTPRSSTGRRLPAGSPRGRRASPRTRGREEYRSERSTYGTISPALRASASRTAASIARWSAGEKYCSSATRRQPPDPASDDAPALSGGRSVPRR